VGQYLDWWLGDIKPRRRESTWIRYEGEVRNHLKPSLGRIQLGKLNAQQIQTLYGQKLGEGLAPASVAHLNTVLGAALGQAVKLGMVQRNVATMATTPSARVERRVMRALSFDEVRQLLDAASDDPLEASWVLAVTTGMRRGELLALQWNDVHLGRASVQVRHSLWHGKGGVWSLKLPKTARSRRKITLSQLGVAAMRRHRASQDRQRLRMGSIWQDHDLVFTDDIGQPLRGNHILERRFLPLLEAAGLPRIRFHDLRHTAATSMLMDGIPPIVVSEMLGHSSIAMTSDLYGHVMPDVQRSAAASFDRLYGSVVGDEAHPASGACS